MSEQTKNLLGGNYNPDVLECLANLSNDEVFTPPKVVNQMLDMLPPETWNNPNLKFLDPACKTGVFLREIAKRLIVGLEEQIPNLNRRLDHIFKNQLYGIAITELTALTSRRTLYCSKYANGKYSVAKGYGGNTGFQDPYGNIRFVPINHTWENGKCKYCGASASQYQRADDLETHAYEFIHTNNPEEIFGMKFDVIIGNPPYQMSDGGNGSSAKPIYNLFFDNSLMLSPNYLCMIMPSRWMIGGKGLDDFRDRIIHDKRIRYLFDYLNASECFPGVEIKGGVCYLLLEKNYSGPCSITTINNNYHSESTRYLCDEADDVFIRRNEALSILQKVKSFKEDSFMELVSARRPFGFDTTEMGHSIKKENDVKIIIRGGHGYISNDEIKKNKKWVDKYKIYITKAYGASEELPHQILNKPIFGDIGTCCSETYIVIGPFDDAKIAKNVMSYVRTKLFRFLVYLRKISQDATKKVYFFVPMQDFSKSWNDEELYTKYNLTKEEIAFIDATIKPMEDK